MDWIGIGLAITIAAVAALLVGVGWLLIFGRRDEWPEGRRDTIMFRGHQADVVWSAGPVHVDVDVDITASLAIARAAWAVFNAWRDVRGESRFGDLERVAAWILPDGDFEREAAMSHADPKGIQAYLVHVRRRLGQGPPLIVMRASLVAHLAETGQPAIHELFHAMPGLYRDRAHATVDVWERHGDETAERRAAMLYRAVVQAEA